MKVFKIILLFLSSFLLYTNVYAESNLVIESVKTTEKSSTMVVSDLSYVDMTITSKMEFHTLNDFVTYEIEIKNNSEKTYTLSKIIDHLNTNYLKVESNDIGLSIDKGERKTIHVKVKYVEELINVESIVPNDSSFTLNFVDTTVIENPFTLDTFYILFIACILLIVIVGGIIYYKKLQKMVVVLLLFIPIYVFAQEMININFNFSKVSVYGRFLSYHIQLDDGSGNVNDYTRTYGEKVGDLPVPEKAGYTFEGWVDQNDRSVTNETVVEEDLDLTASFDLIHYTITYNIGDGELVLSNPTSYTVEDEFTLYNPVLVGYTFLGWILDTGNTLYSEYTIHKGTTGNLSLRAVYSPNLSTVYTVIHKQMNLEGVYEEYERETLHGSTESSVSPQPKEYPGFKIPETQTITIAGDGSSIVTYLYERNKYTFQVHNREDIESATEDGLYYYGTRVNVTAKVKLGYTLLWNDGSELYERSFLLENDTILTPSYTANVNTPYKVIHKQMNLDGETYTVYDEETFYGTTDTTVTPLPNDYEGFTSPEAETITITGDGHASVTYLYIRNQYQLTIGDSEFVQTSTPSGTYYYGTSISLQAKNRTGYQFIKWSNDISDSSYTFTISGDTTIAPIYQLKVKVTFNPSGGEVTPTYKNLLQGSSYGSLPTPTYENRDFLGWSILPSAYQQVEYIEATGTQYIDTGYTPTEKTGFDVDFNISNAFNMSNGSNGFGTVFGVRSESVYSNGRYDWKDSFDLETWNGIDSTGNFAFGQLSYGSPAGMVQNTRMLISMQNGKYHTSLGYETTLDLTPFTAPHSLYLFALYDSRSTDPLYYATMKLYAFRLYENDTVVRDYIPCYRKADNVIGLYELYTNTFYPNNGTGTFLKGQDVGYVTDETIVTMNHDHMLYAVWKNNTIQAWPANATTDFHNSSIRNSITEIEFVDLRQVSAPSVNNTTSWDVSILHDQGVIAWLEGTKLYIGGRGGVVANEDSSSIFSHFSNLTNIIFHDYYDTSEVKNMSYMFQNSVKIDTLDLSSFDTSNVEDMTGMFAGYSGISSSWGTQSNMALREINVSSFDTKKVTSMDSMFTNCGNLISLDLSNFNTSMVTTMANMFNMPNNNVAKLQTITFGDNWDTSNVTTFYQMFLDNVSLLELDLTTFDTSSATIMQGMFNDCTSLVTIYATDSFVTTNVTNSTGMFSSSSKLVGGYGTKFNSSKTDKAYARLATSSQAGYFTLKENDTTISGNLGYVTNGLKIHFDGIQNTIQGHNNASAIWGDLTKSGYDGILKNSPTWGSNYLQFDGVDDWVDLNEVFFNENITVEAVVEYLTVDTSEKDIATNFQNGGYGLGTYAGGNVNTKKNNAFSAYVSGEYRFARSTIDYEANKKYILSGSYDGNIVKLFENGVCYTNSYSGTVGLPNRNTHFILGGNPDGASAYNCYTSMKLYSLRIYNRALTDEELSQNLAVDRSRFNVS